MDCCRPSLFNFGPRGRYDGRYLRIRFGQDADRHGDDRNLPAALPTESYPHPILFRVGVGLPIDVDARIRVVPAVNAPQPSDNTQRVRLAATASRFDYAWNAYGRIGDVQRFTFGVSF